MLDIKFIVENKKLIQDNIKKRNQPEKLPLIGDIISKFNNWKSIKVKLDNLRHERNTLSKEINTLKKQNKDISKLIKQAKELPKELEEVQNKEKEINKKIQDLLFEIPNLLNKNVPKGKDENDNKEIRKVGKIPKITNPLSHVELGEKLDILDFKTSAKITGAGFYILKKQAAMLERALINFMLDFHSKKGRTEIWSPILAKPETAFGTAHLPKFDQDMYKTREGLYLIPTAEMTLTNLHREEVLNEEELPKYYCAYTPCFRTEAGKHGTETQGLFRLHQFDKIEMVTLCKPKDEEKELKNMLSDAEEILKKLKVPYRVIILCSGDTGFKESITYDIETWSPFLKKYMETSSVSTCRDFQARRMNTKYIEKNQREYVYTLNGSGLALPRLMISILENNQQKDGSIKIPTALHKYLNFKKIESIKNGKNKRTNKRRN